MIAQGLNLYAYDVNCCPKCVTEEETAGMKAFMLEGPLLLVAPDIQTALKTLERENVPRKKAWEEWQEAAKAGNFDDITDPSAGIAYHKAVKAFKEHYGAYPWEYRPYDENTLVCLNLPVILPPASPKP